MNNKEIELLKEVREITADAIRRWGLKVQNLDLPQK